MLLCILEPKQRQKLKVTGYGYGYGYGSAFGYGLGGRGGVEAWQYDEGTLLIDFIDIEKNELIWRGSGTKILADHPSVEDKIKNINDAVAEILQPVPSRR